MPAYAIGEKAADLIKSKSLQLGAEDIQAASSWDGDGVKANRATAL